MKRIYYPILIFGFLLITGCTKFIKPYVETLDLNKPTICYFDCRTLRVMDNPRLENGLITDDSNLTFFSKNCFNVEIKSLDKN